MRRKAQKRLFEDGRYKGWLLETTQVQTENGPAERAVFGVEGFEGTHKSLLPSTLFGECLLEPLTPLAEFFHAVMGRLPDDGEEFDTDDFLDKPILIDVENLKCRDDVPRPRVAGFSPLDEEFEEDAESHDLVEQ